MVSCLIVKHSLAACLKCGGVGFYFNMPSMGGWVDGVGRGVSVSGTPLCFVNKSERKHSVKNPEGLT